ncbi:hypothetical protein LPB72_16875 [Hydrogenophaga crassostreae]|uniref:DUF883 domain-containing protein n=1 Tax=Hydrogenophaga crassostreae TaxID=1763535 RepID=A0A167H9V7_9BURK|nr:hypothetical protein [Hydrogenophaga crassostreae]AOW12690.1 hypothetical protein LPB072_07390 [Hydrogenophaga crassostreae]OAD40563.1 hypothetical protein LPB72_16875 [Hydrogenophaga crassostreae]
MTSKAKNAVETTEEMVDNGAELAEKTVAKTAAKADNAIDSAQHAVADAEKSIQAGLRQVKEAVPVTLSRAAIQAEELARSGIDKARAAGSTVAVKANKASEQTADYVRREPTKALLMAAAAGAAATLLVGWATRRRDSNRY